MEIKNGKPNEFKPLSKVETEIYSLLNKQSRLTKTETATLKRTIAELKNYNDIRAISIKYFENIFNIRETTLKQTQKTRLRKYFLKDFKKQQKHNIFYIDLDKQHKQTQTNSLYFWLK